jgi:MSHA biogenesis protein MshO
MTCTTARMRGFTLLELVIVIAITSIIAVATIGFIAQPIEGYLGLSRRAQLVDSAETALRRMSRESRLAVPNTVRVDATGRAMEFLRMLDAGRYRTQLDSGGAGDPLDFTTNRDSFDVLGPLTNWSRIVAGGGGRADCLDASADCVVVYNTGQVGANVYTGDNIAAIEAAGPTSITFNNSDVAGWRFPFASPSQRFYVVDTPVAFICDLGTGLLTRYQGYTIAAAVPGPGSPPGGASAPLVNGVTACTFSYNQGTATRGGLVTLAITLTDQGESVSLLLQSHVPNSP